MHIQKDETRTKMKANELLRPVIIVEADIKLNHLIDGCLNREGFKTLSSRTAEEATSLIMENKDALLLLEYNLPDMSVKELLGNLTKQGLDVPFVVMTGTGDAKIAVEMMKMGALDYIVKSKDFTDLIPDKIKMAFDHLAGQQQLKITENALKKSEHDKRLILQSVSELVSYQNNDLQMVWANQAAADSVNATIDDLDGRYCYEIWAQRSEPCDRCPVLQAMETGKTQEQERVTPDGRYWFIRTFPVREDDGQIIGAVEVTREITKQKNVENRLRENEEKYKTMVESSIQGLVIAQSDPVRLSYASKPMEKLTGFSPDELMDFSPDQLRDLIHVDDRQRFFSTFEKRIRGDKVNPRSEYRIIHKNGCVRWLEIHSTLIAFNGEPATQTMFIDITEQKSLIEALSQSEEKYRTLIESSNDSIFVIADGKIQYVNKQLIEISEYKAEQLVGQNFIDFISPDEKTKVLEYYRNRIAGKDVPDKYESAAITKFGKTIPVEVSVIPIQYQGKSAEQVICRDISRRKKAEFKLTELSRNFSDVFKHSPDGIVIADEKGKWLYVNNRLVTMLGYSVDECLKLTFEDITLDEGLPTNSELYKGQLKRKAAENSYEQLLVAKNGKKIAVQMRITTTIWQGEKCALAFITDITARKQAENEIKQKTLMLNERVKELNCLYEISKLATSENIISEQFYQRTVDMIPFACQYPERIHAKLVIDGKKFTTQNYRDTLSHNKIDILVNGQFLGYLNVGYGKSKRSQNDQLYLQEKTALLKNVVDLLSIFSEKHHFDVELSKSEERFRVLAETSPMAIMLYQNSYWIYANPAAEEISGYTFDELKTMKVWDIVAPEFQGIIKENAKLRESGKNVGPRYEFKIITKSGQEKWVLLKGDTIKLDNINSGIITVMDITARIQSENELIESERRFKKLSNLTFEGILIHDNGVAVDCNQSFLNMFGYNREEIIDKNVIKLLIPEEYRETVNENIRLRTAATYEVMAKKKDGSLIPIQIEAKDEKQDSNQFRIAACRDITERNTAEEKQNVHFRLLNILNRHDDFNSMLGKILEEIKLFTGFEAVGIRLEENDDYPYIQTNGFPDRLVELERYLCLRDAKGRTVRDANGNPYRECMCGNVIRGRTDPRYDFFTDGGSFWSNNTTELLAETSEEELQTRSHSRCNEEGYESVALIPLKSGENIVGLLQFNDRRKDRFNIEMIEYFENIGNSIGIAFSIHQAHEELQDSEEFNRSIIDNSEDCIKILDLNGNLKYMSKGGQTLLEIDDIKPLLNKSWIEFWKDDDYRKARETVEQAKNGKSGYFEGFCPTFSGTPKWWSVQISPIFSSEGKVDKLLSVSRDITKAKQAENQIQKELKEKEILLRELYHRTKNNMQVISSMLTLKARNEHNDQISLVFKDIENQILSMAAAHEKLYESKDLSRLNLKDYIGELIMLIRQSYSGSMNNINILEDTNDIMVLIDTAIPFGLIINELLTNAVKHAFPDGRQGIIQVSLNSDIHHKIILEISDDGVGLPENFDFKKDINLGLQTVFDLAEIQLGGKLKMSSQNGLHIHFTIDEEYYQVRV